MRIEVKRLGRVLPVRSRNGTLVNGRKIGVHQLKNREVLEIGDVQLRFLSVTDSARDAAPLSLAPRSDFSPFGETAYPRTILPRR